mmetsp:Transcript_9547/g.35392  ORF Transcript_9547/g.35392 Transcript_9547/m.35392 type:complete len:115 (-) Transcript_9547:1011-1355(-)
MVLQGGTDCDGSVHDAWQAKETSKVVRNDVKFRGRTAIHTTFKRKGIINALHTLFAPVACNLIPLTPIHCLESCQCLAHRCRLPHLGSTFEGYCPLQLRPSSMAGPDSRKCLRF